MNVLVQYHNRCQLCRTPLRVVATQRAVLRPLYAAGADDMLEVYPTVADALRRPHVL
ncbi:STAS domain-containing protein [Gandjariella thermophila]|uniref:STAS domain-containing protein n=1 Tax=Gandjariella thermophila TaxID=1931992 RepID=A0A4D4JDB5_9PSEU|nr:STAS domain-containing protein [Gandjariella thermophila]GDY33624.1 hypothetical protein GTS_52570 [Gandjariella thermophila]